MSRCDLTIEIDDAGTGFRAGHPIRGHVSVTVDADTRIRSLRAQVVMRTTGPNGTDESVGGVVKLFSGDLAAGESKRFAFELEAPDWPAAYFGYSFQIEHAIEAYAEIPWAADPTATVPIRLIPDAVGWQPPVHTKDATVGVWLAKASGLLVPLLFTFRFLGTKLLMVIVPTILVVLGLGTWLLLRWFPERRVGRSEFELSPQRLHPGDWLTGHLTLRPRRRLRPERVLVRLTATEICRTSKNKDEGAEQTELYARTLLAFPDRTLDLAGDQPRRLDFRTRIPPLAAYSLKLPQHELVWSVDAEIVISGPIRWQRQIRIFVAPPADHEAILLPAIEAGTFAGLAVEDFDLHVSGLSAEAISASGDDVSFAETAWHFWESRDDPERIALLVEAVAGLPMEVTATIGHRSVRGGSRGVEMLSGDHVVSARFADPPLPLTLYIPEHLDDDQEGRIGQEWRGVAEVVGWDAALGGLQMRVTGSS